MPAGPLLENRHRLLDFAVMFKITQHHDVVGQIARIHRSRDGAAQHALLDRHQNGHHAALPQVGQKLMQVRRQKSLVRHRIEITVDAVDDDHFGAVVGGLAHGGGKFTGRKFGRVDLLNRQQPAVVMPPDVHAQTVGAVEQVIGRFFKQEHGAGLFPAGRSSDKLRGQ